MNKKLSIVIPVYNIDKYIGLCLESVMNQDVSKEDYEVICVDDGSTDNSLSILREYENKYNNINVIHKENGGVCSARNCGLENATGEYICFLDGDDIYIPNTLSKLFAILGCDDIIQFNMTKISENFEEINKEYNISNYQLEMCGDLLVNKVFKRKIIKDKKIRFKENMYYAEDTYFVYHYLCYAKTKKYLYDFIYLYRQRETSALHNMRKGRYIKQFESVKIFSLLSNSVLMKVCENDEFKKELEKKSTENGKLLLYLSPLTNEKKRTTFKFVKENELIKKGVKAQSWKTAKYCKSIRYKLKFYVFDLLRFKLFYYIFYDVVKIIMKIKHFK